MVRTNRTHALRARSSGREKGSHIVQELKSKKPGNPGEVPVASHDGIICVGEAVKGSVGLTFPKGGNIRDSVKLFNQRLESSSVRTVGVHENKSLNEAALISYVMDRHSADRTEVGRCVENDREITDQPERSDVPDYDLEGLANQRQKTRR